MGDEVFVVIEQMHSIPTDQTRRAFTTEAAAEDYIEDEENVGNYYVERLPLNEGWA